MLRVSQIRLYFGRRKIECSLIRTSAKGSGFRLLVTPKSSMLLSLREKS